MSGDKTLYSVSWLDILKERFHNRKDVNTHVYNQWSTFSLTVSNRRFKLFAKGRTLTITEASTKVYSIKMLYSEAKISVNMKKLQQVSVLQILLYATNKVQIQNLCSCLSAYINMNNFSELPVYIERGTIKQKEQALGTH